MLDVTCESLSFRSRRPGLPLSGKPRTRGSGIHLHARERRDTERAEHVIDLRAETASSSDKTEFTETEDQSRTHHGSTLGTDPSGRAAQREGLKAVFGGTEAQEEAKKLQASLEAMWPGATPAHGGGLFEQPSMTPSHAPLNCTSQGENKRHFHTSISRELE